MVPKLGDKSTARWWWVSRKGEPYHRVSTELTSRWFGSFSTVKMWHARACHMPISYTTLSNARDINEPRTSGIGTNPHEFAENFASSVHHGALRLLKGIQFYRIHRLLTTWPPLFLQHWHVDVQRGAHRELFTKLLYVWRTEASVMNMRLPNMVWTYTITLYGSNTFNFNKLNTLRGAVYSCVFSKKKLLA